MSPCLHAPPRPPSERRTTGRIPPAPPDFGGDGDDDREHGPRRGLDNLRLAVLFFMGAEAMFFGALISALLVLRLGMAAWPPPLEPRLPIAITGLNTLVLLASSVTLVTAGRARRRGEPARHVRWLQGTAALGALFLAVQGYEWIRLIGFGLSLASGVYGTTFFALIGLHGLLVLAALVWLVGTTALLAGGRFGGALPHPALTRRRHEHCDCSARGGGGARRVPAHTRIVGQARHVDLPGRRRRRLRHAARRLWGHAGHQRRLAEPLRRARHQPHGPDDIPVDLLERDDGEGARVAEPRPPGQGQDVPGPHRARRRDLRQPAGLRVDAPDPPRAAHQWQPVGRLAVRHVVLPRHRLPRPARDGGCDLPAGHHRRRVAAAASDGLVQLRRDHGSVLALRRPGVDHGVHLHVSPLGDGSHGRTQASELHGDLLLSRDPHRHRAGRDLHADPEDLHRRPALHLRGLEGGAGGDVLH